MPGQLWIVEDRNSLYFGRVVAWERGPLLYRGPVVDVGPGRIRGAAADATGEVLVLRDPVDDSDTGLVSAIVSTDGLLRASTPIGVAGYWQAGGRTAGGWLLVQSNPDNGRIIGLGLDDDGVPIGTAVEWGQGGKPRVLGDRVAWTGRTELGELATSYAHTAVAGTGGTPGATVALAREEQQLETYPCPHGCGVAPGARGSAWLWLLAAIGLLAKRSR